MNADKIKGAIRTSLFEQICLKTPANKRLYAVGVIGVYRRPSAVKKVFISNVNPQQK
jgi:hypothetical protein